jgi:Trypsin-like peptidase domain
MNEVDPLTLTTVPVHPFFNDTGLGVATGFVYRRRELYFITNWHVVTARNAETGKNLNSHGGRPNLLRAQFNFAAQDFGKEEIAIKLRDEDGAPLWLVHPVHPRNSYDKRIDVVAIPLSQCADHRPSAVYPINDLANAKLKVSIGMDVFILGYPFGAKSPGFPVWKRGSIASEPDLVRLTDGYYLVDTASRPGMSGSPVILRSWTNHMTEPGVMAISDRPLNRFIGVYSGRLEADKSEAQIGIVWHESYIDDIIDGNRRDAD